MKKFILSMAVLLAASFAASAQVLDFYVGADVNGIDCFTKCNYDKFVSVFGKPDKYEKFGDAEDEEEMSEVYYFGESYFVFQNNGDLHHFAIEDKRFAALTKFIKGGVRVGDKISRLDNIIYGKPKFLNKMPDGKSRFVLWETSYDPVYFHVKDGIILCIVYNYLD